ncbi:MAG TPA: Xaa-Pro peptidase family protein [Solirubrobacteraceae bacterium]|nr:Xaa-Pro peptidase family protein [Solirubrobacteraceae bacterium]
MAFAFEEHRERLARTRKWMAASDLDLLILAQPEHYNWLCGYEPTSAFYYQALLVPAGDEPVVLLCNKAELALCEETCWVEDVRTLWTHEDQIAKTLEALNERGWADARRVGVNLSSYYFKARYAFELQHALPRAELVDVTPGIDELRLVKSPAEIELLRRAAHIADLGVTAGINAVREGVSDRDVMAAIQHAVALNGGEFPAYPTLVDARGTLHGTPTGKIVAPGDTLYLEVDGVVRRYHTNISRTVVIGQPSRKLHDLYLKVRDTLERATDAMRPGATVPELVELVARCHDGYEQNTWGRFGFSCDITYPPHWIGALSLMKGDTHVLQPGMVITMEPGLAYYDGDTMMLGNNVLVTDGAPEVLNNVPIDLFVK